MTARTERVRVLEAHGAGPAEVDEILRYAESPFRIDPALAAGPWPLPDEPFVEAWDRYAEAAASHGAFEELRRRLIQLRFPVEAGISATERYRAATRRGEWPAGDAGGVRLEEPERLQLIVHPTPAGRIPVLIAGTRGDFVTLVRALARRNEPETIPDAMGACILGGFNNWDRIRTLRAAWESEHPGGGWPARFREIVPQKALYQDTLILLSRGPYSAVPASSVGVPETVWEELSLRIRLEHECAHYFTRRIFGSMRNALHDELIADFAGIVAAAGRFRADWFLRFMGVERFPEFRAGGRLEGYRGAPPLSDAAFTVLQGVVCSAARALEALSASLVAGWEDLPSRARALTVLASLPLEELAGERRRREGSEFSDFTSLVRKGSVV